MAATIKAGAAEPFEFQVEGIDQTWELPSLSKLPVRVSLRLNGASEGEATTVMADLIDEHCPGLLDQIDAGQLSALMEMWGEHSGISLGE